MACQLQYLEASQFFEFETTSALIIVSSGTNLNDELKFNLDQLMGEDQCEKYLHSNFSFRKNPQTPAGLRY